MQTTTRAVSSRVTSGVVVGTDWGRLAALGGVVFFIMLVIAAVAPGASPPAVDATTRTITDYYVKHHTGNMISNYVNALGTIFFLAFVAALWRGIRQVDDSGGVMAVLVAAGGVAAAAMAMIASGIDLALTYKAAKLGDPVLVRALFDVHSVIFSLLWFPLAGLIGVTSIVALRASLLPRWLAWAGLAVSVVMLVGTLSVFADSQNFLVTLNFIAFILFGLWTLAASIILYRSLPAPA